MAEPQHFLRRSFVYRQLLSAGAEFDAVADSAVAMSLPGEENRVGRVGLIDLSPLPRTGLKGRNSLNMLSSAGLAVPDANNRSLRQQNSDLIARLSDTEALILGNPNRPGKPLCITGDCSGDGAYSVPRRDSHAWFAVLGPNSRSCLSKLCAIDLRCQTFGSGCVAQCHLAGVSVILLRDDLDGTLVFHLLTDSASAGYMWDCLIDSMAEFGGGPVGLSCLPDRQP